MLTIYADFISPRLKYTLSMVMDDRAIAYQLTDDWQKYEQAAFPKFSYSRKKEEGCLAFIPASQLLTEATVSPQKVGKSLWEGVEVLSFSGQADILASIFYVLSLYDDCTQKEKDKHGRLKGENSILFRHGWLEKLTVEHWCEHLLTYIEKENQTKIPRQKIPFSIVPTFDIDHAYAYKLRSNWRTYFSLIKDVLNQEKERIIERSEVLNNKKKDPYDTYDLIERIAKKYPKTNVFWLLGDYGKFDKNCAYNNKKHQELIQKVNAFAAVGLHPSYASQKSFGQLEKEKKRLENTLDKEVLHSRQHFLRIQFPTTFERLEKAGFQHDYSLGYADQLGFRAGVARPFLWFNLFKNEASKLTLHPITYMDGTLNEYLQLSVNEAVNAVRELKNEVERFGGEFIPLWHNETIGDYKTWNGWRVVLEDVLLSDEPSSISAPKNSIDDEMK